MLTQHILVENMFMMTACDTIHAYSRFKIVIHECVIFFFISVNERMRQTQMPQSVTDSIGIINKLEEIFKKKNKSLDMSNKTHAYFGLTQQARKDFESESQGSQPTHFILLSKCIRCRSVFLGDK